MLVDAGRQGNSVTVLNALAAEGITRLDYIVGSHEDADHIGGMVPVLSYMELGEYVNNGVEDPDPSDTTLFLRTYLASRGITPRAVEAGDTLALDPANVTVTVLNPQPDRGSDDNEAPVVLRLVYGGPVAGAPWLPHPDGARIRSIPSPAYISQRESHEDA